MRKLISLLAGPVLSFSIRAQTNSIKHIEVYLKPVTVDFCAINNSLERQCVNLMEAIQKL